MTTAYDFPELDISPILCEDEDLNRVKQKVVQTSPSVDQITLRKALRDLSISGFENVNDEGHLAVGSSLTACDRKCRKEFDLSHRNSSQRNTKFESSIDSTVSKDSCNTSSEVAFKALEVAVEKSLLPPTDSCDISCSVQSSISNILGGCRITVEMGCCKESAEKVRSRLRRMGAVVSRRIPACVLGNRCPSALKGIVRPGTTTLIHDFHKKQKGSMMFGVIRRRTHSAFPLEYREPMCDAVLYARMNKIIAKLLVKFSDEQDAIAGRSNQSNFSELCFRKGNKGVFYFLKICGISSYITSRRDAGSKDSPSRNSVTSCAENAFQKQGLEKEDRLKSNRGSEKCFESLENNSELAGLLGLHSPSHGGVYGPLVKTSSSLINNLQLESSSEEFVRKKHSRIAGKYQDGVVFTGFPKQKVKKLRKDIADLGLKVQQKIDTHTYCLISANGERTLNTLCAVIFKTPVIKPDWICACLQKDTLLPFDQFYYEEWWKVIQKRGQPSRLFSSFGKIFLCEGCSPPPSDLRWLVENSGGEVSKEPSECSLVVAPREHSLEIFCSEEMSILPVVVIEKYILDCISENAVLSFEDYKEHEVIDDLC
ncbi:BRCA1 protein [Dictyocaulus viviparus]|uniref:BRCA1 protein n=1 Tax=Dictyocaulus viviparus TaxID=29172 RepID=A0A0D8X9M2_DICVI|nr:BRCA1 protein [Dictyocaulus viviparus]